MDQNEIFRLSAYSEAVDSMFVIGGVRVAAVQVHLGVM